MITKSIIILDKSGSMGCVRAATISGFNELIQQNRIDSTEDKPILTSLVTFNGDVFENFWNLEAKDLQEITEEDYVTEGGTAMQDAIGYAVQKLLNEKEAGDKKKVRYVITIITDGETNADKKYNAASIKELRDSCEKAGNWTFTFVGCSERMAKNAQHAYGFSAGNMAYCNNINTDAGMKNVFRNVNMSRRAFMESDNTATVCMMAASADEMADYTAPLSGGSGTATDVTVTTSDKADRSKAAARGMSKLYSTSSPVTWTVEQK